MPLLELSGLSGVYMQFTASEGLVVRVLQDQMMR